MANAKKNKKALTDAERKAVKACERIFTRIATKRRGQEAVRSALDTDEGKASDPGGRKWMERTQEVYDYIDRLYKEANIDASDPDNIHFCIEREAKVEAAFRRLGVAASAAGMGKHE